MLLEMILRKSALNRHVYDVDPSHALFNSEGLDCASVLFPRFAIQGCDSSSDPLHDASPIELG